jgi:glycerol-3-phosphate dehydrogenase
LLAWASSGNSGIVCTGVDASPGTLERSLIRDSIASIRGFCRDHNIPNRPCGSLVCRWPWDQTDNLDAVLQESHEAGDTHASELSTDEVRLVEPNLSTSCVGAVHIPGEIVVDPWLFSIAFAVHARENGAKIYTDWKFDPAASHFDGSFWTAVRSPESSSSGGPAKLKARAIVNAAGLWSDDIQSKLHQNKRQLFSSHIPVQWTGKPRRGQYGVFQSTESTRLRHPIQPVPTQRTKGIFVFTTLYDQIVVGPTALDQDSKTDRSVDRNVVNQLSFVAKKVVPALDIDEAYVGSYVGIRPGTDKRDYQIHSTPDLNYIAAAGIRSTGLTASLGIGRHVVYLLSSFLADPDSLSRPKILTTPLPSVANLVKQYHKRGNGCVCINGWLYRVTHPLTIMGWDALSGIASIGNRVQRASPRCRL